MEIWIILSRIEWTAFCYHVQIDFDYTRNCFSCEMNENKKNARTYMYCICIRILYELELTIL